MFLSTVLNCRITQFGVFAMTNHTVKHAGSTSATQQSPAPSSTAADRQATPKPIKPNLLLSSSVAAITADVRRAMIAEAAYYIAEQRGFGYGRDVEDWLLAEKQIDATISA